MRIAIVTAHYLPEMGYIESQAARTLTMLGHEVRVLTSAHVPARGKNKGLPPYEPGLSRDGEVEVERLPHRFSLGQVAIPKGLKHALDRWDPDLCLAIGIGKLFPGPILCPPSKREHRLVAIFGNAGFNFRKGSLKAFQKRAVQRLIKDRQYRAAVSHCDKIWTYTPETEHIIREFLGGEQRAELEKKLHRTRLGFDPSRFYRDDEEREGTRRELGIDPHDRLFLTATRPIPSKDLDTVIDAFETLMSKDARIHYLLIGSSESSYDKKLEERMEASPYRERFHFLPFQREETLRAYYNAADIGLWTAASITIQKAMGTGLPVLIPKSPSLGELLAEKETGSYYRKGELEAGLERVLEHFGDENREERKKREERNRKELSEPSIMEDIVERSMRA